MEGPLGLTGTERHLRPAAGQAGGLWRPRERVLQTAYGIFQERAGQRAARNFVAAVLGVDVDTGVARHTGCESEPQCARVRVQTELVVVSAAWVGETGGWHAGDRPRSDRRLLRGSLWKLGTTRRRARAQTIWRLHRLRQQVTAQRRRVTGVRLVECDFWDVGGCRGRATQKARWLDVDHIYIYRLWTSCWRVRRVRIRRRRYGR